MKDANETRIVNQDFRPTEEKRQTEGSTMTPTTFNPIEPPAPRFPDMHKARNRVRESKPLICPYCDLPKPNKAQMAVHLRVTHGISPQQALDAVGESQLLKITDEFSDQEEFSHDSNGAA